MNIKEIKDRTIPSTWKRLVSKNHKYIIMQGGNTNNMTSEVYHSDDCTLNNRVFLFDVKGGIEQVKLVIGKYEYEQDQDKKDLKYIDNLISKKEVAV